MANIQDPNFNKNVSMVYVEQPGFTGYRGFDFTKIDDIEDILRSGLATGINNLLSSILTNTTNIKSTASGINQNASSIDKKLFVTGDLVTGTIVYQADLSAQFDNVDIAGYAGADISGLNAAVSNNFPVYDTIELKYDGSSNNTGVFYNLQGSTKRIIEMKYNGSNLLTGIKKTDF